MTKVNQSRIREALTAGTNVKEKGPPVADGILSVTPDTPEMLEWRSRSALDVAETSSTFLDDEEDGPKPHELYGKFTWKIENFSEISKRELRSNVFDVGSYKWYILVYPQGCDVCNHLSLFLCVADYDKLLPGWSHFAQFTIAVVNKDPKKSKYSDTLHRFCKKEHDWGWKKFMELSKVLDGFTVADTLVIKAQVQVILDKPSKPFRCLDPQYRRELVRVYLTNVEGICRRFCEDKKARLSWAREEAPAFRHFWSSLAPEQQRKYLTDKGEVILKAVVKQFFNEKEVTSTLVMDALYSGCKQIEEHSRSWLEGKCSDNAPVVLIKAERNSFTLCGDLMDISDRVQRDFIPAAKDDSKALQPNDGLTLRSGQEGDDYRRDSIERDEKRLAELGRKTIEMFVIAHIFCEKLEIAYREAEALKRQDQLIAEEFEMARLEESKAQAKAQADKEKKAKKKEKMKLRKEAEKLRREAEEAERRVREEEARRLEAERKAKEAEKKRLEDAQPHPPQQAHGRKGAKGRDEKRAQAAVQQHVTQQAKGKHGSSGASAQLPQQPQQPQAAPGRAPLAPADRPAAAPVVSAMPTLSALAAAAVAASAGVASTAAAAADLASQAERPDLRAEALSGSSSDEEVGTVSQATGAPESSGDADDEVEGGAASSAAGPAAGPLSDSDGESEGRAALEEEVIILRAQVKQLQKLLAEKDAELFALRAQLAELQPTEIADMVREGAAAPGPSIGVSAMPAQAASSSVSSSSSSVQSAADGASVAPASAAVPNGIPAVALREAGSATAAENGSTAASAPSTTGMDRGGKPESPAANGPSGPRPEITSPSTIPAAAAAAAAAAVRRMHPLPVASAGPASSGHDSTSLLHSGGVAPARPSSTGPSLPGAVVAAASIRAMPATSSAPHLPQPATAAAQQQPGGGVAAVVAAPSSDGLGAGGMMQRSTSATLPSATGSSSAAGSGAYSQLAPHQLAAAAAAAASANGRSRQHQQQQALDGSATASAAPAASGTKPVPYMPPSAAGAAAGTMAAGANGIGGVHSSAAAPAVQDGLPSYRNAAAGVLAPGQSGSGAHAMTSSAGNSATNLVAVSVSAGSLMPVSPSAQAGASSGPAAHKRAEDGASATVSAAAAAAARHISHAVGSADGAFSATNARIMMQQAQRQGLAFGTPTAVQSKRNTNQMDSPGLEDFAHINMIDDLLTE